MPGTRITKHHSIAQKYRCAKQHAEYPACRIPMQSCMLGCEGYCPQPGNAAPLAGEQCIPSGRAAWRLRCCSTRCEEGNLLNLPVSSNCVDGCASNAGRQAYPTDCQVALDKLLERCQYVPLLSALLRSIICRDAKKGVVSCWPAA